MVIKWYFFEKLLNLKNKIEILKLAKNNLKNFVREQVKEGTSLEDIFSENPDSEFNGRNEGSNNIFFFEEVQEALIK